MRSKVRPSPLLALLLAVVCLCGCASGATEGERQGQLPQSVVQYWAPENGAELILFVSGSTGYSPGPLEITETAEAVTVSVHMEPPPGIGLKPVSYGISVGLKAPLGGRKVIDTSREAVEVPVGETEPVPGEYLPAKPSEVIRR